MNQEKNSYQKSLLAMKANISRVIAVTLFLVSFTLFFILAAKFVTDVFHWELSVKNPPALLLTLGLYLLFLAAVLSPLELGMKRWFYDICTDVQKPLTVLFSYFGSGRLYFRAVWFRIQLTVLRTAVYVVYLLPAIIFQVLILIYPTGGGMAAGVLFAILSILRGAALIIGLLYGFYFNLRYFMANFLFFQNPTRKTGDLIRCSKTIMKERRPELAGVFVSLLPFYLVCLFVLPLLLLVPYLYIITSVKGGEFLSSPPGRQKGSNDARRPDTSIQL